VQGSSNAPASSTKARSLLVRASASGIICVGASASFANRPTGTADPSADHRRREPTPLLTTATPLPPGYGRDLCDPDHTLPQPCALASETELPYLNFNDGTVDVFSFLLKGGQMPATRRSRSLWLAKTSPEPTLSRWPAHLPAGTDQGRRQDLNIYGFM